jgi:hypothetical protein
MDTEKAQSGQLFRRGEKASRDVSPLIKAVKPSYEGE